MTQPQKPHLPAPTEAVLRELLAEYQDVRKVAHHLGYAEQSRSWIYALMKKYGIPHPGDDFDRLRQISLTPEQRAYLSGMLLGDASIPAFAKRAANCTVEFSHTRRQEEYGAWKASLLAPFIRTMRRAMVSRAAGEEKKHDTVLWSSIRHPDFTEFRSIFYPDGKKTVPPNIADLLTIGGIALWYQDDGSLDRYKGNVRYCLFATESFSVEGNHLLIEALRRHCGITPGLVTGVTTMYKGTRKLAGSGCRLYVRKADMLHFCELIRPYVHPSMLYKLV